MITNTQVQEAFHKARRAKDRWQAAGASEAQAAKITEDRKNDWLSAQNDYDTLLRQQREEQAEAAMEAVTWVRWNDALGARHGTNVPTDKVSQFVQALLSAGFTEIDPHTPEEY